MKKVAAIIENGEKLKSVLDSKALFVSYDAEARYGYLHFDNGEVAGTHMDPPTEDIAVIDFKYWYEGEPREDHQWLVTPSTKLNVVTFLCWRLQGLASFMNQQKSNEHAGKYAVEDLFKQIMDVTELLEDVSANGTDALEWGDEESEDDSHPLSDVLDTEE